MKLEETIELIAQKVEEIQETPKFSSIDDAINVAASALKFIADIVEKENKVNE